MKVASVIINNSSREVDKEFDYLIPCEIEEFIKEGSSVIVPFGIYNNFVEGYVLSIKDESDYKGGNLKKISDVSDDVSISSDLLSVAKYIKEEYLCTLSDALKLMVPPKKAVKQVVNIKFICFSNDLTKKLKEILLIIENEKEITLDKIKKICKYKVTMTDILLLEKHGCILYNKDYIKKNSKKEIPKYTLKNLDESIKFVNENKKAKKQVELIKKLIESKKDSFTMPEIVNLYSSSSAIVRSLVEKGILEKSLEEVYRNPNSETYDYDKFILTEDQINALETIVNNFKYGKSTTLLHGVTGCGKTEIYLNLVEKFMNEDYGSIVMVPEIALTPQTVERFKGRFGDTVAIIHSRLSDGERYDQFRKIKNGEYKVVIGARSAVFSPVKDLKLIIIDEEHEYSYKSESNPRYLTRSVAEFRVNKLRGCLVLGSATPSIESYYKSKVGDYGIVKINKRVKNLPMPSVSVVNMKDELLLGNKSMFSRELYKGIKEGLDENNQTILFLNRRGYSTFVSCRSCGYVCECEHCTVTLTYHHGSRKLKCHHCGKEYNIPELCPKCKSKYIKYFGVGTEKVQKEVEKYFNGSKVSRMDVDTTRKKGSYEKIYKEFKNKEKDILIGTQMVSKGMDFPYVTLVGVISADVTLNIPDFRSSERTFQLLTQVAGRAGRGEKPGKVIIQTYNPDHFSLKCAVNHDYDAFYSLEIENRRLLNYPPFSNLMHIVFVANNQDLLERHLISIKEKINKYINNKNVVMIGPSPCHILKVKDKYRWHIIFKGDIDLIKHQILDLLQKNMQNIDIGFMIDIDPYRLT